MAKPKMRTKTQAKALKLHDAVSYAASCLKEAGDPLHGLGPSQQYADAFDRYSQALKELLAYECSVLHVADWGWNGYEGTFHFYWEFSASLPQPDVAYEHETRFFEARCPATLDPQKPLNEEVDRLRAEAAHYSDLKHHTLAWAAQRRKAAQQEKSS